MQTNANIRNGYILAGGKSTRMGEDKGLLMLKDKTLIAYSIEVLSEIVDEVVIVTSNIAYKKFGLRLLPDIYPGKGPAGGIHAALHDVHGATGFILSCDMPFITKPAVSFMIAHSATAQITIPQYQGIAQPLFGVYSKSCLPKWEYLIQQGIVKLQEMILQFDLVKLTVDQNKLFRGNILMNINDRPAYQVALNYIHDEN